MHMVIRNIVYAEDHDSALVKAKSNFEILCEDQRPFDYYGTYDMDGVRFGDKFTEPVYSIESDIGRQLVRDGWRSTLRDMRFHLKRIKKEINSCNINDLMKNKLRELQYDFYAVGQYRGESCWLYDDDSSGIKDRRHLDSVLSKWEELYTTGNCRHQTWDIEHHNVYVVPADVHY